MKKQHVIFIALLLVISSSCLPLKKTSYTVPAGKHRSTSIPTILKKDKIRFSFTTDSTWYWPTPTKNGWSKVIGIGWNSNHENSARVVYRMLNDSIGVFGDYYYVNGVSPQQNHDQQRILDTIQIGKKYHGQIGYDNGYFFVELNDKFHSYKVGSSMPDVAVRLLQHLYIGGVYVIDHDWHITQKIR